MTAGLPVGIAAWLRILVSFFLIVLLLASAGEASAGNRRGGRLNISITSPVNGSSFSTSSGTVALAGEARDPLGVRRVTWQNDRGGGGEATGTEIWSIPGIQLASGVNTIVVTAYSSRGGSRQDKLVVTYTPAPTSTTTTPPVIEPDPTPPDTTAPTAPSGLGATVSSSSQINLSWGAASDSVGVTGYRIERCQGAGCASFAQIATASGTAYTNTGLSGSTSYSYRVRATDAAGNLGGYSAMATAVTSAANRAPVISGSPATQVVAGSGYSFTPTASDLDDQTLTFSVDGAPTWSTFNPGTGELSGTPGAGQVGLTEGIVITVSDGTAYASLPAFSLAVVQAATGSATVSWLPPTERTDGSALTNLDGYHIKYGTSPTALNQTITLNGAGLTSYTVEGLTPGNWYFGLIAFDTADVQSATSNIGSKTIL